MPKLEILKREFPRLRRRLDFGEFAEELAGNFVEVWLNPSREFVERFAIHAAHMKAKDDERRPEDELLSEAVALYAELWDCTIEQVQGLFDLDAGFCVWLMDRTWNLLEDYRKGRLAKNRTAG